MRLLRLPEQDVGGFSLGNGVSFGMAGDIL